MSMSGGMGGGVGGGVSGISSGGTSGIQSFSNYTKGNNPLGILGSNSIHHQTNSLAGLPMNSNTYDYHNSSSYS